MRWLLICFLILINQYCVAQQYYETYSPANGLVDARITRILQDGTGRLFFLTKEGVSVFDGQRFSNHTKIAGTPIGIINDGMLLPDGNILLATFGGKWVRSGKNGFTFDSSFSQNIPEVSGIIPLPGAEWLIISNTGLFRLKNGASKKINLVQASPGGRRRILDRFAISGDHLVFCFYPDNINHGVYAYDIASDGITDSLATGQVYGMTADDKGRVFLCTASGILQLNKDELQKGKLRTESPWFSSLIPAGFLTTNIFFDRQENIWLIDNNTGCRRIDPVTGRVNTYSAEDGLLAGINSVYQDRENNYWFIAPGRGVQKLVQTNYEIVSKLGNENFEQVLSANSSEDSSLFLCTRGKLLILKNGGLREISREQQDFPNPVFYWQNNYWTFSYPLLVGDNGKISIRLDNDPSYHSILPFASPFVTIDQHADLLLAGNHISLIRKDHSASTKALPYFADNIAADENNGYWAFCRSNDIIKFSLVNNELTRQSSFKQPGVEARFALHFNKDTFWIATRYNGILIAKVNERSFTVIGGLSRQQGLSNDFVETLLRIDGKRIAAGTAVGLDIITLAGNDTLIENVSARINHFEPILQLSRDNRGMVYARTENLQLFKYDPFTSSPSGYQPAAWLSRIMVNGRDVDTNHSSFNYLRNNVLFSVTSPSFTDSRSIIFRFVLAGEKRQWEQNSNKPDFEINNLPPGNYELSVVIKYAGRSYPDKKLNYHFTINPPFWKTWWFILVLVLVILLSAYYIVRSYLKRQLQRQKMIMEKELAIEQERTKMARELHDGLGSMLSGVKHSFSAMKNRLTLPENEEAKFHFNIEKLNESIKELRNISHSMASESLLKYGLENSLRDYCNNVSQSGELKISFEALGTEQMLLRDDQSFHIFRIVQELLQNIIKHADATETIIQLSYNKHRLYITVEDNGNGFELHPDLLKKGIGLKNIESRTKILNGRMDYQTAPSKGTSVMIEIPCEEKS